MSETLEVRTSHAAISEAVQDLAKKVDDDSIRLASVKTVRDGEWVRFSVRLKDDTVVLEGVGRCQGATASEGGYEIRLTLLQFDERNEIMYERVLIARDTDGPVTGLVDVRGVDGAAKAAAKAPSAVPPPPRAMPKPSVPSKAAPKKSEIPPPLPPKKSEAPPPLPPKASAPKPPPRPRETERVAPPPPKLPSVGSLPAAKAPEPEPAPAPSAPKPAEPDSMTPVAVVRPSDRPSAKARRRRIEVPLEGEVPVSQAETALARSPKTDAPQAAEMRILVAKHLVQRARTLAPTLPPSIVRSERASPEEAVLQSALRLGLAALAALADAEDEL